MIAPLRFVLGLIVAAGALLLIALTGGGWLALDRLDPLLAVPGAGLAAMLGAIVAGRMRWWVALLWGVLASVAMIAAAVGPASSILPDDLMSFVIDVDDAIAASTTIALIVQFALQRLPRWRRSAMLGATLLIAFVWQSYTWSWVVPLYAQPATNKNLLLVSALPLVDPTGSNPSEPFVERLQQVARLTIRDSVTSSDLAHTDFLMLVQPRAMAPEQLVLIDDWIRAGGHAIIFADGLLVWPPRWPLGDPRNAPVTSLLTPLLSHWGLRLDAPAGLQVRRIRRDTSRDRLFLLAPGSFSVEQRQPDFVPACDVHESIFAACRLGRGTTIVFADADMLHADMWQGSPAAHGAASDFADTPTMLSDMMRDRRDPLLGRRPIWWHCAPCRDTSIP